MPERPKWSLRLETLWENNIIRPRPLTYKCHWFVYTVNVVEDVIHEFFLSLVQRNTREILLWSEFQDWLVYIVFYLWIDSFFEIATHKLNMYPTSSECAKIQGIHSIINLIQVSNLLPCHYYPFTLISSSTFHIETLFF